MADQPTSKFIKVRCPKCKNEQIIFGNSSSKVGCLVCNKELAYPTGGKSRISARVLEVLE
ncbi:MAG TPA: 30S ribosomal protein S27e [Candidatus Nanoarchaeia archaeon]|nr:30S ribosomal protein S27e [Candidatus Nanoarchaeia archaeon]